MNTDQLTIAEQGIRSELVVNDSSELISMLGAIKAVQGRNGDTHHVFEINAIVNGLRLERKHRRAISCSRVTHRRIVPVHRRQIPRPSLRRAAGGDIHDRGIDRTPALPSRIARHPDGPADIESCDGIA